MYYCTCVSSVHVNASCGGTLSATTDGVIKTSSTTRHLRMQTLEVCPVAVDACVFFFLTGIEDQTPRTALSPVWILLWFKVE